MSELTFSAAALGILLITLGVGAFVGMVIGYRFGQREGRGEAELNREQHWVDLLERSVSQTRSRAAHPSRSGSDPEHSTR
jgi:membrane protein DedA with SNARE-associated domain